MKANRIRKELERYEEYLRSEEKSPATVQKYMQSARGFLNYGKGELSKEAVVAYKEELKKEGYAPTTVNAELSGIRSYLRSKGRRDIEVKNLRVQRSPYVSEKRNLSKGEYERLIRATGKNRDEKLRLILETICATGIRVSELRYISRESVEKGEAEISLKGKSRKILIVGKLRKKLLGYIRKKQIESGAVFVNGKGEPLHRSYVWQLMKKIAKKAGVNAGKVYPHNLRRLFARRYYSINQDIAGLADVLGHSSINTTRIYIATPAKEHVKMLERLELVI